MAEKKKRARSRRKDAKPSNMEEAIWGPWNGDPEIWDLAQKLCQGKWAGKADDERLKASVYAVVMGDLENRTSKLAELGAAMDHIRDRFGRTGPAQYDDKAKGKKVVALLVEDSIRDGMTPPTNHEWGEILERYGCPEPDKSNRRKLAIEARWRVTEIKGGRPKGS